MEIIKYICKLKTKKTEETTLKTKKFDIYD